MKKLDKVIAGLSYCCEPNNICEDGCPYHGRRDGDKRCLDFLMEDALELLKKQDILRAELAEERERSARWVRESEPVVHAHWFAYDNDPMWQECSNCGYRIQYSYSKDCEYCPHCGAHMDEEVADD